MHRSEEHSQRVSERSPGNIVHRWKCDDKHTHKETTKDSVSMARSNSCNRVQTWLEIQGRRHHQRRTTYSTRTEDRSLSSHPTWCRSIKWTSRVGRTFRQEISPCRRHNRCKKMQSDMCSKNSVGDIWEPKRRHLKAGGAGTGVHASCSGRLWTYHRWAKYKTGNNWLVLLIE